MQGSGKSVGVTIFVTVTGYAGALRYDNNINYYRIYYITELHCCYWPKIVVYVKCMCKMCLCRTIGFTAFKFGSMLK